MKKLTQSKYTLIGILIFLFGTTYLIGQQEEASIDWMSWEEAMEANKLEPRKKFVDVYTQWCGWCKKMDATTFKDPAVIKYLNENFYAIKFDAEQKGELTFDEFTYKFVNSGRRGYHQFAQFLLDGKLSYPSFVLLDEEDIRIMKSPGYKTPDKIILELQYANEEKYKVQSFTKFKTSQTE